VREEGASVRYSRTGPASTMREAFPLRDHRSGCDRRAFQILAERSRDLNRRGEAIPRVSCYSEAADLLSALFTKSRQLHGCGRVGAEARQPRAPTRSIVAQSEGARMRAYRSLRLPPQMARPGAHPACHLAPIAPRLCEAACLIAMPRYIALPPGVVCRRHSDLSTSR
jgi:hypothetical protein